jgi:hypothetical protein
MDRRAIAYLTPADCKFQTIALRVPGVVYPQHLRSRKISDATIERALMAFEMNRLPGGKCLTARDGR